MTTTYVNRHPGRCEACGKPVPASAGQRVRRGDRWVTVHAPGRCPPAGGASRGFDPTPEQAAIVSLFLTGEDLVIEAGAGASKTTTLSLCAEAVDGGGERPLRHGQYVAFNKKLVVEAGGMFGGNVGVSTVHALAYKAIMAGNQAWARRIIGGSRMRSADLARAIGLDHFAWSYGTERNVITRDRLAGMAMRAVRTFCQSADLEPTASHVGYVDGIDLPAQDGTRTYANNDALRRHLLPAVRRLWADLSNPAGGVVTGKRLDFVYLKAWALDRPVILADFILVDEAQDLSGVMLQILDKQSCQRVLVGDSAQAIYGFLGLVDALAIYRERGVQVGRLTLSFRFGQAVADVANGLLERAGHDLRITGFERVLSTLGPHPEPTAILCRSNARAVRYCLELLGDGHRPHLVGGATDVVEFARAAQALMDGEPTAHPELSIFDTWEAVEAYVTGDEQGEDLRLMVKLVTEFGPEAIITGLSGMFSEADADVVVSTAHKSKGCGWDVVRIADDFTPPRGGGELSVDELRLAYVAVTRAKRHLDLEAVPHFLAAPAESDEGEPEGPAAASAPAPALVAAGDPGRATEATLVHGGEAAVEHRPGCPRLAPATDERPPAPESKHWACPRCGFPFPAPQAHCRSETACQRRQAERGQR